MTGSRSDASTPPDRGHAALTVTALEEHFVIPELQAHAI